MVAKINILNSCTNVVAKINIRVFKIYEQLRLKFWQKNYKQPALKAVNHPANSSGLQ